MPGVLEVVMGLCQKDLRTNSFTPACQGLVKNPTTRVFTTLKQDEKKAAPRFVGCFLERVN
jgi:hypothetical protein